MTAGDPCRFLEWDSLHFNLRIARVEASRLTSESVASIRSWCERESIDCVYFLAEVGDVESGRLAEGAGFRAVDLRVTMERDPGAFQEEGGNVRRFEAGDLPDLCRIARTSHQATRFYRDGRFPRSRCDDLYETWIRKSCGGDAQAVFVAAPERTALGYLTCHLEEPGEGKIGLMAVAEELRGKGLGRALVRESLRWFGARSVRRVSVVTQGDGADGFYRSCKFTVRSVQTWYHGWFREAKA